MKTFAGRSALVLLMASVGLMAAVRAQKTSYDFDRTADFSKFKTYAWREGTPAGEVFLDKRIVAAIDGQLAAKGLTRSDGTPDLYVVYHVAIGMQKSISGTASGMGPGFGWHGGLDTFDARLNELPVGALVIDLADAAKRELVWRGIGVKEIDVDAKPEKRDAAIVKAVEKILTNYPPKTRG
jgi:hypothetical protein